MRVRGDAPLLAKTQAQLQASKTHVPDGVDLLAPARFDCVSPGETVECPAFFVLAAARTSGQISATTPRPRGSERKAQAARVDARWAARTARLGFNS